MLHHGMNKRDFDRAWRALGGEIEIARRTGEAVYSHPKLSKRVRVNSRRKDVPRVLTAAGLQLLGLQGWKE